MTGSSSSPEPRRGLARWRRPGRLFALGLLAACLLLRIADPILLQKIRLDVFDLAQRRWPGAVDGGLIRIVAIDEASLRQWGQWPWPRARVAELVRRIAAGRPRVLGIDILFAEPDGFSPARIARTLPDLPQALAQALAGLPSGDTELANAIHAVPTVLGVGPSDEEPTTQAAAGSGSLILPSGGDPRPFLTNYPSLVRSIPEITAAAAAPGALAAQPDIDGIARRVPLIVQARGMLVPGFADEVIGIAAGDAPLIVTTGTAGIESVAVAGITAPTDRLGRVLLDFAPTPASRYLSAATVLAPSFDSSPLAGKIVLLAVTGLGLQDLWQTPLGPMQGIEIHAQAIQSLLLGDLLTRPAHATGVELAAMLACGVLTIWLIPYERPVVAAGIALGVAVVLIGGELALFRFAGWLVDGGAAAGTTLVTFAAMLDGNLRAAQTTRRLLAAELDRERQVMARLDGEVAAARALQMGLLPRRFPAFPDRHDIDLNARIEPARSVGGDLFDFLLIGPGQLFFMIADVSGKGIPAALFMAMTKEVVRDAARRHGMALELVLGEANDKTAAASAEMPSEGGDMMFVTAFAGILDLASGEIAYASAGHDAPYVLRAGAPPRRLETVGGPPLGAIEDFAYPIDHDRLAPDELLVLYTDGVTEAIDAAGTLYGTERLTALLAAAEPADAKAIVDAVFDDVRRFAGTAEQADDITMLALRRTVPASA